MSKFASDNEDGSNDEGDIYSTLKLGIRISIKELISQITTENVVKIVDLLSNPTIDIQNKKKYKKIYTIITEYFNNDHYEEHYTKYLNNEEADKTPFVDEVKNFLNSLKKFNNFYFLLGDEILLSTNIYLEDEIATHTTFSHLEYNKTIYEELQKELNLTNCEVVIVLIASHAG